MRVLKLPLKGTFLKSRVMLASGLSVLQFTDSVYTFGIFKLFLDLFNVSSLGSTCLTTVRILGYFHIFPFFIQNLLSDFDD